MKDDLNMTKTQNNFGLKFLAVICLSILVITGPTKEASSNLSPVLKRLLRSAIKSRYISKIVKWDSSATDYEQGVLYATGHGGELDYVKARECFEKAANQNFAAAQYNLGVLYAEGLGTPQDYAQACEWFKKAAAQNHANAQYILGLFYQEGIEVKPNLEIAKSYYRKAAEGGVREAKKRLEELGEK